MTIPEVRIYFSWLLYEKVSVHLAKLFAAENDKIVSQETADQYAENYRQEWAKYSSKILPALVEALGVEFRQNIIDVPCAPWVHSMSDPLIMSFQFFPDQFVDALTHELCHVLLTDNTTYSIKSTEREVNLRDLWAGLFGQEHDFNTLVHIPVHALSKYIYVDVLHDPSRLKRDIQTVKDDPPYKAAWEFVEEGDYKHIINQLAESYRRLRV